MPKVALSGYTKVRLLTIIRKQPHRHGSTADICFHFTISLKSSGFDDCMSGFYRWWSLLHWCSCCPATFLFFRVRSGGFWPSYCISHPIVDPASDLATYTNLPVIFLAVSPAILPAITNGDLSDYLQSGSMLTQRRWNRGGDKGARGARSPLQSAGRKYLFAPA